MDIGNLQQGNEETLSRATKQPGSKSMDPQNLYPNLPLHVADKRNTKKMNRKQFNKSQNYINDNIKKHKKKRQHNDLHIIVHAFRRKKTVKGKNFGVPTKENDEEIRKCCQQH